MKLCTHINGNPKTDLEIERHALELKRLLLALVSANINIITLVAVKYVRILPPFLSYAELLLMFHIAMHLSSYRLIEEALATGHR